ncbi:hypothetical protein ZHAS_00004034 [Anopheles sinensis]|uniref:Uncharacterized protein n=1 Tax=Anopheles sinensis TaxID=74873 RepID=A0A084VFW8_ANOSI|nr:hypothetical protein ZHAS_00004034 [Anopheles sinensis]
MHSFDWKSKHHQKKQQLKPQRKSRKLKASFLIAAPGAPQQQLLQHPVGETRPARHNTNRLLQAQQRQQQHSARILTYPQQRRYDQQQRTQCSSSYRNLHSVK